MSKQRKIISLRDAIDFHRIDRQEQLERMAREILSTLNRQGDHCRENGVKDLSEELLRQDLIEYLRREQESAIGCTLPLHPGCARVPIDPSHWDGRVDWKRAELIHETVHYVGVKVLAVPRSALYPKAGVVPLPQPDPPSETGRPAVDLILEIAYERVSVDHSRSLKWHEDRINAEVAFLTNGDAKELSYNTIHKHLGERFKGGL